MPRRVRSLERRSRQVTIHGNMSRKNLIQQWFSFYSNLSSAAETAIRNLGLFRASKTRYCAPELFYIGHEWQNDVMKKRTPTLALAALLALSGGKKVDAPHDWFPNVEHVNVTVKTKKRVFEVLGDDPRLKKAIKTVYDYVKKNKNGKWNLRTEDGMTCVILANDTAYDRLEKSGLTVHMVEPGQDSNTAVDFEADGKYDLLSGEGGIQGGYFNVPGKVSTPHFPTKQYKELMTRLATWIDKNMTNRNKKARK